MIIKINSDKERARSILKMVESEEKTIKELEKIKIYSSMIVKNYYEIIKELCIAIGFAEGYKAVGENFHKDIINFVGKYKEIEEADLEIMQDLRIRRNKSSYEGLPIEESYLENQRKNLINIISKLKIVLKNVL